MKTFQRGQSCVTRFVNRTLLGNSDDITRTGLEGINQLIELGSNRGMIKYQCMINTDQVDVARSRAEIKDREERDDPRRAPSRQPCLGPIQHAI